MNYLAHLLLAEPTPESLIGNFLGDFVKGSVGNLYTEEIRRGIELHRKVDIYTDAHPIFRASKTLVSPERRKFAGILIDVFYDHFLANNWDRFSDTSLGDFSARFYRFMADNRDILPESVQLKIPLIIKYDLLQSYRNISGIEQALLRISARIKRRNNLAEGLTDLVSNYQELESDFLAFFPHLINYAQNYKYMG